MGATCYSIDALIELAVVFIELAVVFIELAVVLIELDFTH